MIIGWRSAGFARGACSDGQPQPDRRQHNTRAAAPASAPDEHALVHHHCVPAHVVGSVLEDDHVAVAGLLKGVADGADAEGAQRGLLAGGLGGGLGGEDLRRRGEDAASGAAAGERRCCSCAVRKREARATTQASRSARACAAAAESVPVMARVPSSSPQVSASAPRFSASISSAVGGAGRHCRHTGKTWLYAAAHAAADLQSHDREVGIRICC